MKKLEVKCGSPELAAMMTYEVNLYQNSQAVKRGCTPIPKKASMKRAAKSKVQ